MSSCPCALSVLCAVGAAAALPRSRAAAISAAERVMGRVSRTTALTVLVGAAIAAAVVAAALHFEVPAAAAELAALVANSPDGSFTTPSRLTKLCGEVAALAEGRVGALVALLCLTLFLLQTFAVPVTFIPVWFIGALLDAGVALPLCVAVGLAGATCCYLLSKAAGTRLAEAVDNRVANGCGLARLRASVDANRGDLLLYLIVLRLSPVFPPALFNLGCPVARVPLPQFAAASVVGLIVQGYFDVRIGSVARAGTLQALANWTDAAAVVALVVVLLGAQRLRRRFAVVDDAAAA